MRQVIVYTSDNKYDHFLELVKELHYVKKVETDEDRKDDIIDNLKRGFEEMQLIKQGKLKTTPAKDFLNAL